ncbi:MAG TPA: hypothetical protein VJY64_01875 [Candidatus Onthovivens sp.]|nr:hypothetical protein [Candidatus Onthovivens sp.]
MIKDNIQAFNLSYILLEYYKELNIDEYELAVILMTDHLISQGNTFIDNKTLSLKMKLELHDIDLVITNLYKKRLITMKKTQSGMTTSLEPLYKLLMKHFKDSMFTSEEQAAREEQEAVRERIYEEYKEAFERDLTPIEVSRIEEWIQGGVSAQILSDSLKDAKKTKNFSFYTIDKFVTKKTKEEDNFGNTLE